MAPLLLSALVGIGVKVATDLFMSGVKKFMEPSGGDASSSFATTLDKARAVSATANAATGAKATALDAGLADRSRVLASDFGAAALPGADRAQGADAYRRLAASFIEAP